MTAGEACDLAVLLTRQLSVSRGECESWRLLALVALQQVSDLTRELEMVDARNYVHRTRTQDDRGVWADHRDLRREAA